MFTFKQAVGGVLAGTILVGSANFLGGAEPRNKSVAPAKRADASSTPSVAASPVAEVAPPAPLKQAKPQSSFLRSLAQLAGLSTESGTPANQPQADPDSTHEFARNITVKGEASGTKLQTLCADADGHVLGLVAAPRMYSAATADSASAVHVFDADGALVRKWSVKFHAHSINVAPDGSVYVAGDGKVASYSSTGELQREVELPHIAEMLKDTDKLRAQAEAQLEQTRKSRDNTLNIYRTQIKALKDKPADKLSRSEKARLNQLEQVLKQLDESLGSSANQSVDNVVTSIVSRLRIINSVAVSKRDVFIVCGDTQGYGYAIWRMDHDFGQPTMVLSKVSGCCGQMDVQVSGEDLLVAENTKHRFARYDRDGKELMHAGKRALSADPECFGGCCNPMNLHASSTGEIYTAESEGIVKRFAADGKFLGVVGHSTLSGGCKNVAVAASPDGNHVFFCDQPGSQIVVLAKKQ